MKTLNQYYFYYGAILNAIFERNIDASPTLLEVTDKRGIYRIITNTSKKEYIAFCKYAFQQENKSTYKSWKFAFSDEDKRILNEYYEKNFPIFIYFLCGNKKLNLSEIAICSYEEYSVVKDKQTITIGKEKNKSYFNLHVEKSRSSSVHLKTKRVEQSIDQIIDEIVNFSPEHYKTQIKQDIKISIPKKQSNETKRYERAVSGQNVTFLSLSYRDDDVCPIHNEKMPPIYVHIGKLQDTAYYCQRCGKYMIPANRYEKLVSNLGKTSKFIEFEAII